MAQAVKAPWTYPGGAELEAIRQQLEQVRAQLHFTEQALDRLRQRMEQDEPSTSG